MMKKVLVWGTGVNALDFVKGHRSLEIIAYIDNRKKDKEWGVSQFCYHKKQRIF